MFPKSSLTSSGSLQVQHKKVQKTRLNDWGTERGAWLGSPCTRRSPWKQTGSRVGRHSLQWLSAALSNLPLGWHTQCLPDRTCLSPCLPSSASHHTGCEQSPSLQTLKSPFCIPSALDSLVLMIGWPEALPGCSSPAPHGRSLFPALLLPLPDPLALPSPLVASDHKRAVSFSPPA